MGTLILAVEHSAHITLKQRLQLCLALKVPNSLLQLSQNFTLLFLLSVIGSSIFSIDIYHCIFNFMRILRLNLQQKSSYEEKSAEKVSSETFY